jgi:hypothetical protein
VPERRDEITSGWIEKPHSSPTLFQPTVRNADLPSVNQNVLRQAASAILRFHHCLERGAPAAPAPQEKAFRPMPVAKCSGQNQTISCRSIAIPHSRPYLFV